MLRVLAKIGDWKESSRDYLEVIEKIDKYIARLRRHKKNIKCASPKAEKIIRKEINLQIEAFYGYRKQMALTSDVDGKNVKSKYCD